MAPRLVGQKLSQSDRKRRPAMPLWIILLCIIAIGWLVNYHPPESKTPPESATKPSATTVTISATPTPKHKSETVRIGEIGQLRAGDSEVVYVAATREANDAFTKAAVTNDREGIAALMLTDRLWPIRAGTKVRVLGYGGFLSGTTEIRILEGGYYSRSGWVPSEWVIPTGALESATPEIRKAKPAHQ